MNEIPNCPKCGSEFTYADRELFICPECGHEFTQDDLQEQEFTVKDSNGATLHSGDNVTIIKDLKVKGSSGIVKIGTKIKAIRLVEASDDHTIDCKIPGVGAIRITPKYVKKS